MQALQHAIDFAEDEFLLKRQRLERALTGLCYGVAATLVASLVIAMYLPIFKLGQVV